MGEIICVLLTSLLSTILFEHKMILGMPAFETGINGTSESNPEENFEEIQMRMACSYNQDDWCKVGRRYCIPCKLPKQCPGPNAKFMECINGGMCHECIYQKMPCSSDAACCKIRIAYRDSKAEPEKGTFCKLGTCSYCVRSGDVCVYLAEEGQRELCCPTAGQQDLACRVTSELALGMCVIDPCLSGNLPEVLVHGFDKTQPRCDGSLPSEKGIFDYQCLNKRTCARCLGYDAKCGMAIEGGDICCDYLRYNKNNSEFKTGCFPEYLKCRKNSQCCSGSSCYIRPQHSSGFCITPENKQNR